MGRCRARRLAVLIATASRCLMDRRLCAGPRLCLSPRPDTPNDSYSRLPSHYDMSYLSNSRLLHTLAAVLFAYDLWPPCVLRLALPLRQASPLMFGYVINACASADTQSQYHMWRSLGVVPERSGQVASDDAEAGVRGRQSRRQVRRRGRQLAGGGVPPAPARQPPALSQSLAARVQLLIRLSVEGVRSGPVRCRTERVPGG
ncbi:hypothetical protein J6590_011265 [Homalodisca vitripennis]|nr:hypothetical protein J6590_011265 [Homalodisca vitripennis]